jgi:hypothetical protein
VTMAIPRALQAPRAGCCVHCNRRLDPHDRDERLRWLYRYVRSGWDAHLACTSVVNAPAMDAHLLHAWSAPA